MLRAALLAALLLLIVGTTPAAAEEVRVGPCEVDACVYACVHVEEMCRADHEACVLLAFRFWCL